MSNPYESPTAGRGEVLPDPKIWRRVWWPAAVLVAISALQWLLLTLVAIGIAISIPGEPEPGRMSYGEWFIRSLGTDFLWRLALSMAGSLIILVGAWQALRLRSLTMARISAGLACIPLLTPLLVAGLPFGVWLVVALFQRETVAEFQRLSAARGARNWKRYPEP